MADGPSAEHRSVNGDGFPKQAHRWHTMIKLTAFVLREPGAGSCLSEGIREGNPTKKNYFGI
jgi:hypothetical protein